MQVAPLHLLSYSYNQVLHLCPRKFEIMQHWPANPEKIKIEDDTVPRVQAEEYQNVDFAFGHCVHAGVQSLFRGESIQQAIWHAFLAWDIPLYMTNKSKTFWTALDAIHQAQAIVSNLRNEGWEIVELRGKPSIEINFIVDFGKDYHYQGHIDVILRNRNTEEYKIFEIKTTVFVIVDEAMYMNSNQTLGYSVILDKIAPAQQSYEVVYLVWSEAKAGRHWSILPFIKSKTNKAEWIRDVLLDIDSIEHYKSEGCFPKRGEACYSFFRKCPYFGVCGLPIKALVPPSKDGKIDRGIDEDKYDYEFTLMELITNQLDAAEM